MKKIFFIFTMLFLFSFIMPDSAYARLLPRYQNTRKVSAGTPLGAYVSVRLRGDRLALLVSFGNLQKVTNATYTLMYQTNGVDQGVSGSLDSSAGNSVTRELLFGTCSSGVCRYHSGITNMTFEVNSALPNGKQVIRRFRIRV